MKRLLLVVLGLGILVGLGLVVLLFNLNPVVERMRPLITDKISEVTGTDVSFEELKLSLFPTTTVSLSNLKVGDGSAGSLEKLQLATSLSALLQGRLKVTELTLVSPVVGVKKLESGELEVAGVKLGGGQGPVRPSSGGTLTGSDPQAADNQEKPANESLSLDISAVGIENGRVRYSGMQDGEPIELQISALSLGVPWLSATSVKDAKLEFVLEPKGLPVTGPIEVGLEATGDLSKLSYSAEIDGIEAEVALPSALKKKRGAKLELSATGELSFTEQEGKRRLQSVVASALALGLSKSSVRGSANFLPEKNVSFTLVSDNVDLGDLQEMVAQLAKFKVGGMLSLDLAGQLDLSKKDKFPNLEGSAGLKQLVATVPRKEGAGLSVSVPQASFLVEGDKVNISSASLSVGGQAIDLSGTTVSGLPKNIQVLASARAKRVDLGQIMGAVNPKASGFEGSFLESLSIATSYSVPTKKGKGEILLGASNVKNIGIERLKSGLELSPSAVSFSPGEVNIFGGKLAFELALPTGESRTLVVRAKGGKMKLEEISRLLPKSVPIGFEGSLKNLAIDLSGDKQAMPKSLKGIVNVKAENGAITGLNIIGEALKKINSIPGVSENLGLQIPEKHQELLNTDRTEFKELSLSSRLADGNVRLTDFLLSHELYRLTGDGEVRLGGGFELRLQARLAPELAEGMVLKEPKLKLLVDQDGSIVFPVLVTKKGSVPVVLPDISDLVKRAARNTAKEAAGRALDRVAPGLGDALNSLFK